MFRYLRVGVLGSSCDGFVEYAGDFPRLGGSRQILHAGVSYRPTARQQLDLHAAVGLSTAAPRSLIGVGYSFILKRR